MHLKQITSTVQTSSAARYLCQLACLCRYECVFNEEATRCESELTAEPPSSAGSCRLRLTRWQLHDGAGSLWELIVIHAKAEILCVHWQAAKCVLTEVDGNGLSLGANHTLSSDGAPGRRLQSVSMPPDGDSCGCDKDGDSETVPRLRKPVTDDTLATPIFIRVLNIHLYQI